MKCETKGRKKIEVICVSTKKTIILKEASPTAKIIFKGLDISFLNI